MTMHKHILPIALLAFSAAAHGTIYQCGNTFQGHPCQGATVISGAPTTTDDQSGARYSQMEAQQTASGDISQRNRENRHGAQRSLGTLNDEIRMANHEAHEDAKKLPGSMGDGATASVGLIKAMTGG